MLQLSDIGCAAGIELAGCCGTERADPSAFLQLLRLVGKCALSCTGRGKGLRSDCNEKVADAGCSQHPARNCEHRHPVRNLVLAQKAPKACSGSSLVWHLMVPPVVQSCWLKVSFRFDAKPLHSH